MSSIFDFHVPRPSFSLIFLLLLTPLVWIFIYFFWLDFSLFTLVLAFCLAIPLSRHVGNRVLLYLYSPQSRYKFLVPKKESNEFIFITGGSRGLGRAMVASLLKAGYNVITSIRADKDAEELSKLAESLGAAHRLFIVKMDVTDEATVEESKKEILDLFASSTAGPGILIGLINNAGISNFGPVETLDSNAIKSLFEVNVAGVVRVTRTFLPLLRQAGEELSKRTAPAPAVAPPSALDPLGKALAALLSRPRSSSLIVNISSVASYINFPYNAPYHMSKHAVDAFNDCLRQELRGKHVDVLSIQPAYFESDMPRKLLNGAANDELLQRITDYKLTDVYADDARSFLDLGEMTIRMTPAEVLGEQIRTIFDLPSAELCTRYLCGTGAVFMPALLLLPDRWIENWIFPLLMKALVVARKVKGRSKSN